MRALGEVVISSVWKHLLLLEKLPGDWNPLAHQHLVGGAAEPAQLDALGALLFGQLDQLGVPGGLHDHLGENGLVPVHHDIDLVLAEHAQVNLGADGFWGSEHYILQVRPDHGTAPPVREGGADAMQEDVPVVGVHPDVGAVHALHDFPVHAPRRHPHLPPHLLPALGGPGQQLQFSLLLAEFAQHALTDLACDLHDGLPVGGDAVLLGQAPEFDLVLDPVVLGLALGHQQEGVGHIASVVGVSGRAPGDHADEVAGHDGLGGGSADPDLHPLLGGGGPARPHAADPATDAVPAEPAGRLLLLEAVQGGEHLPGGGRRQSLLAGRIMHPLFVLTHLLTLLVPSSEGILTARGSSTRIVRKWAPRRRGG